jgi:hypothetical protein
MAAIGTVNHSEVRKREREDAEKMYMARVLAETAEATSAGGAQGGASLGERCFGARGRDLMALARAWFASGSDVEDDTLTEAWAVSRRHPRFWALVLRHRFEEAPVAAAGPQSTLGSSVVALTIRSMAGGSNTMDPVSRKLPLSMSVQALKQIAARTFRMEDLTLVRVSFREDAAGFPILLADDLKPLSFYGIADGGEVRESTGRAEAWWGRCDCVMR